MDLGDERLVQMQHAAEVAARVLAELWPEGGAILVEQVADSMYYAVGMESDGITVRRVADVRDGLLYDVISLGDRRPRLLPRGARRLDAGPEVPPGTVAVDIPTRRWWQRRPRPVHWTEEEVEGFCRRLNGIDAYVLGAFETRCRVCGYDDGETRWLGQKPMDDVCHCCGAVPGVDDSSAEQIARARADWVKKGRPWLRPEDRPGAWDPATVLAALPPRWRDV